MPLPKVILGDDHSIVLEGIKHILEPLFDVVQSVEDGRALVAAAAEFKPAAVVTDISMPLLNGIEAVRQIKKAHPRMKAVVLTMHSDMAYALEAFDAGATGYVLKHSASTELVAALREVLDGHTYISPRISREVLDALAQRSARGKASVPKMSSRQREVLQLVAEGRTMDEIGRILHISARTVQYHKYGLMKMLGIRTNAELVQYAVRQGLVRE